MIEYIFWLPWVSLLTCLNEEHNLPMSVKYQNVKECLYSLDYNEYLFLILTEE